MGIVFKFTLKRSSNDEVETHYVKGFSSDTAIAALANHLNIDSSIIKFNGKNLPFIIREKIFHNVTEEVKGKMVTYKLTLDLTTKSNKTTQPSTETTTSPSSNEKQTIQNEFTNTKVRFETVEADINLLFKDNENTIVKYSKYTIDDSRRRLDAYEALRKILIENNFHTRLVYPTEPSNDITYLDILDAYTTNNGRNKTKQTTRTDN